ncbi:hypothetical protein DFA_05315 [Cavenderia fasciculata]|uniref:Carbohydrate binding domain-containing protein n=1 Tax=Cavenderia fasciculata TaxID=261658 RepID=F4PKW1_CACFS|nr:uncharacterized protein DFA_05315 [Cavenderia fasciculata]EGG23183.1 hypothetical protein DFA_05315 [Cavenderia fasciculata]|eukprot:XP_004361034.1 hypothetical protein DFA_05315 [Cavenderia fasciculata]
MKFVALFIAIMLAFQFASAGNAFGGQWQLFSQQYGCAQLKVEATPGSTAGNWIFFNPTTPSQIYLNIVVVDSQTWKGSVQGYVDNSPTGIWYAANGTIDNYYSISGASAPDQGQGWDGYEFQMVLLSPCS